MKIDKIIFGQSGAKTDIDPSTSQGGPKPNYLRHFAMTRTLTSLRHSLSRRK